MQTISILKKIAGWAVVLGLSVAVAILFLPGQIAYAQEGEGESDGEPRSPDECASCHADQYEVWHDSQHADALADPRYIEAANRAGNPTYCQSCHATGYDAVEGTAQYEGVGCLACHTDAEGNHPSTDMTVDKSSELCGTCHTGNHAPDYDMWLVSNHATMNIGCTDCHMSHNTALHMEDPNELCTSCHRDSTEGLHAEQGVMCTDCHMAPGGTVVDELSGATSGAGHSFEIPPDVCAKCHGMTHELTDAESSHDTSTDTSTEVDEAETRELSAQQFNLGLTGGGIGGLIIGMSVPWLLYRRGQK